MERAGNRKCIENNQEDQQEFYPYNGVFSFNWIDDRLQY